MLQAIVAPLAEPHRSQVQEIWKELEKRFNVHSELTEAFPHFSLHVAQRYPVEELQERLETWAATQPPLRVRTVGLGLFNRPESVLYMPLVRNPRLNDFHRDLWRAASGLGESVFAYYRPERWIPHVTLARERLDQYNLGGALHWLSDQKLDWVLDIDELALLQADEDDRSEVFRVSLRGEPQSSK